MSSKNITVTIMAREFIVACPEGQEKSLLDSVQYLNQKIDLIQSQGSIVGIDRIIIMAALNITNVHLMHLRLLPLEPLVQDAGLGNT